MAALPPRADASFCAPISVEEGQELTYALQHDQKQIAEGFFFRHPAALRSPSKISVKVHALQSAANARIVRWRRSERCLARRDS